MVNVTDKSGASNKRGGPGGSLGVPGKGETYSVDTSNILFILSGAFVGLEKIISNRISKGVSLIIIKYKINNADYYYYHPFHSQLALMRI